jgi:UDP-N-acetylglucosamine 3-dehydrogenase
MAAAGLPVGVGLIGLGQISAAHLAGYRSSERAHVVAVCDMREEIAAELGSELRARSYTDFRELLADEHVDLVDIALPHHLHRPVALAAIEAGKHVLVEKPLAASSAECAAMVEAARAAGVMLGVAENTRFVDAYRLADEMLAEHQLGTIRLVRTFISGSEVRRLSDPTSWKGRIDGTVGGAILDAGAHSFYLLRWLFGPIRWLRADRARFIEASEVEDYGLVNGRLTSGAAFSAEFSFTAERPWGERLEVFGSSGTLIIDLLQDPPAVLYRGADDYLGSALDRISYAPSTWKRESIAAGVRSFVESVVSASEPEVSVAEAAYSVMVAEKAYESAETGGEIVSLADV